MDIEKLTQSDIQEFIHGHKSVDIKDLALLKIPYEGELRTQILQQIKSYQKAQHKLPKWATRKGIIFPNPDLVEQASSDLTAEYKSIIYQYSTYPQNLFIDLTAGMGSDTLAFLEKFISGLCVEADPVHAKLLEYNLKILSDKNIDVRNGYAEELIENLPNADLIYIDPQRRTDGKTGQNKRGIYDLSQTMPNILQLLPKLKEKSPCILIKTSPFLDIDEGLRQLGDVSEVHIVEADGQCKEVLYFIDQNRQAEETEIIAVNLDTHNSLKCTKNNASSISPTFSDPQTYLFEPGPALMKSALHPFYASRNNSKKLAPMTHLYTSDEPFDTSFGRAFEVLDILPVKKKDVATALPDKKANISVRNFPLKAEELRKKLNLKDGGEYTLFGTTLKNSDKRLILCKHHSH